jgi:hypothetical protein
LSAVEAFNEPPDNMREGLAVGGGSVAGYGVPFLVFPLDSAAGALAFAAT